MPGTQQVGVSTLHLIGLNIQKMHPRFDRWPSTWLHLWCRPNFVGRTMR